MNYFYIIVFIFNYFCYGYNATYNSFINQTGFCRLQSFWTKSRDTSFGPKIFLDGSVKMGVGLSQRDFIDVSSCGRCIEIKNGTNIPSFNFQLTQWNEQQDILYPFIVMVFDQCTDPICEKNFIDFDIYNELQPVSRGNPYNIDWSFIDCPISVGNYIEYLLCIGTFCTKSSSNYKIPQFTYYWSITIRNHRVPIQNIYCLVNDTYVPLRKQNGWVFDYSNWNINGTIFNLKIQDFNNNIIYDSFNISDIRYGLPEYYGGILIDSKIQI